MRLASLLDAPYAFSSAYEDALRRSDESWREQADRTAQGPDRATFFAFSNNAPVGIAALYRLADQNVEGELIQMWVSPDHRGKRVAWDLLDAVFKWASENSFHSVLARVTRGNVRALEFYRKYGFDLEKEMLLDDFDGVAMVRTVDSQP